MCGIKGNFCFLLFSFLDFSQTFYIIHTLYYLRNHKHTKKKKESKHNTKDNHATTREQKTKRRGKRPIKTIPKQLAK